MKKYEVTVRTITGQMKVITVIAHETSGAISIVRSNYDVRVIDCRRVA
jgi:hypothetical protein